MALDNQYGYDTGSWGGWPDDVERGSTPYGSSSGSLISTSLVFNLVTQTAVDGVAPRYGTKCGEFKVRPGDRYFSSTGERTIARDFSTGEGHGDDYYYGWSTLFPSNWNTSVRGWGVHTEWHGPGGVVAPVRMLASTPILQVAVFGGDTSNPHNVTANIDTMVKGVWNDFVVHIRWDKTAAGLVEVWHKLASQTDYVKKATITGPVAQYSGATDYTAYTLQGFYRGDYCNTSTGAVIENTTHTIYHDGWRRGTSYEEIVGSSPPPPPPIDPPPNTFGLANTTGPLHGSLANSIRVYRTAATTVAGSVTRFKQWLEPQPSSGNELRKIVMYSDSGSEPGTLLGTSIEETVAPNDGGGWRTFSLSSNIPFATGTRYWLGDLSGGTQNVGQTRRQDTGSFRFVSRSYSDDPPSSWDTATDSAFNLELAIIAEYSTQSQSTGSASQLMEAYVGATAVVGANLGTVSASTTTTPTNVAWVPTVSYQPVVRGEFREMVDNQPGAAVKWNQTLGKWEYL